MKKLFFLSFTVLITAICLAQAPNTINYQAVARNNSGAALANQTIKVRLTVLRNAVSQYSETRSVTTNALGLFNIQIGSAGALLTTGVFTSIDWLANTPNAAMLKVELDINNTNTFTDMGTQTLSSVPYAFAANQAIEPVNIAGRAIDQITTPTVGSQLTWNGTSWTPAPGYKMRHYTSIGVINGIAFGGGSAPFVFAGPTVTVTVDGTERIYGSFSGVFGHGSASPQPVSVAVCLQDIGSSIINSFLGNSMDATVAPLGEKTLLSAMGSIVPPAGTYKIGLGIKNKSTNTNFTGNDYLNGYIQIVKD